LRGAPEDQKLIKLAFLIRSLDCGGAERQLVTLAKALDESLYDVTVFTFYPGGFFEKELAGRRVRCVSLVKRGRWDVFGFYRRFASQLRRLRPDVIYGYLDLSNLLSLSTKLFLPRTKVVWWIGTSQIDLSHYDWLRRLAPRLERLCARFADSVIVNSRAGRAHLLEQGFPAEKVSVIHSGIETELFRPDAGAGAKVRSEWGVAEDVTLVGMVGRLDPIKDHETFLRAAALVRRDRPDVRFVCVGGGTESYARRLHQLAERLGLTQAIKWVGSRADMPAVYSALDINVSSSQSEGFPSVVAEAMSCAVPCVVTDVGDSALIVGDTGFVCAPRNPEALAAAVMSCLKEDRRVSGTRARRRILERWGTERLAEATDRAIAAVLKK
jgi:glycosyltransferase involved in cell wall biosynthesis